MQLHVLDIGIIVTYLISTVVIGVILSRKAAKGIDSYFLAGRQLPWYVLSVSHASGMFDITGTMWLVGLFFVYGVKSIWIPWIWPIFLHIFYMVYLAKWVRRSNVVTGAEWLKTRFNSDRGSELAYLSVVIWALISVIAFLAYAFKGIGKFSVIFFPWDLSPNTYALIFMSITTIYVVIGGMYSVVLTALVQYSLLTVASVAVAVIAMMRVSPEMIRAATPDAWHGLFSWTLNDLNWQGLIDALNTKHVANDGYTLFGLLTMMMLIKGFLVSMAMPAPNYDAQRLLATRGPREASLMSGLVSSVVLVPRYLLIAGIAVIGLAFLSPDLNAMGKDVDFEIILPFVISEMMPIGLKGFLLAGLIAAFMSTFDSTVNAGAAYLANDVYKRYLNPGASRKFCVTVSYVSSFLIVAAGIVFGFFVESIDSITKWIFAALWGGFTAANLLKYYWWRLNGYGYFWGMIIGTGTALLLALLPSISGFPDLHPVFAGFPIIFIVSLIGTIAASYLTAPENDSVLKEFYTSVRPWGFWGPVHEKVVAENPDFKRNTDFKRDMTNIAVGIVWQMTFMAIPIYLVIRKFGFMSIAVGVLVATSLFLKKNWYDRLENS